MASGTTQRRGSSARRARPATPTGRKLATEGAERAVKKTAKAATGGSLAPVPKRLARTAATKTARFVLRKAMRTGAKAVRLAAGRATVAGRNAVEAGASRRLPIQLSTDVAVPIGVAWEQWRTWGSLPEGVHRIEDVERDGDTLVGHTCGPHPIDWEAEVVDEREDESFAWRSTQGTDCAGLATFHQISERLTRIELDLDVLPTNPSQALTFALHLAHHHAQADLRRFKAHVEFISPDVYERRNGQNGNHGKGSGKRRRGTKAAPKASAASERVAPEKA